MCYCNCPYENKDGDCTLLTEYPPDSYCKDEDLDPVEQREAAWWYWFWSQRGARCSSINYPRKGVLT